MGVIYKADKIISKILRIGVGNSKVDNASSGGITCGIRSDGSLKEKAFKNNGEEFDVHPTTGMAFDSVTVPNFGKMKEMVKTLHPLVPHFRLVSWDVACDDHDEPVLIEANLQHGELDFHQLNNDPLFGEDTRKIVHAVFNK